MEKRELKFYEAPMVEVVEMEVQTSLLTISDQIEGPTGEDGEEL